MEHCCLCVLLFVLASISKATSKCGAFNFESPELNNGRFVVEENKPVNITFTLPSNCSLESFDLIDIYKWDTKENLFARQCTILTTCNDQPDHTNVFCHCLETQGLYGISLVVQRHDGTRWKWSTLKHTVDDVIIEINVNYPPHITHFSVEKYDASIPRFHNVSISCSWQDGNPPSSVSLLGRHNNLLAKEYKSENVCYTFTSVDCSDTGVIRCEADGSDRNMSVLMLIECPPEIVIPLPKVMNVILGQSSGVAIPFRSHSSRITACHMTQLNQNMNNDAAIYQIAFNLTDLITDADYMRLRNRPCEYVLIGVPPDFHLFIKLGNLKSDDIGLWYVNISNNWGCDTMFIQVRIINGNNQPLKTVKNISHLLHNQTIVSEETNADMMSPSALTGVILGVGVIVFTVIVLNLIYCFRNGREAYTKFSKRGNAEPMENQTLDTDPTTIYCEINDYLDPKDTQSTEIQIPTELCVSASHDSLHCVEVQAMNKHHLRQTSLQLTHREDSVKTQSNMARRMQHPSAENVNTTIVATSNYLQPVSTGPRLTIAHSLKYIQLENETRDVGDETKDTQAIHANKDTSTVPKMSGYSRLIHFEREKASTLSKERYLKLIQTRIKKGDLSTMPGCANVIPSTRNATKMENLQIIPIGNETHNSVQLDYLHPNKTTRETCNVVHDSDVLQPFQPISEADEAAPTLD